MRAPGATCFSSTSVGELKNTIASFKAYSTSPAARPSTPRPAPIRVSRRCLRVMEALASSAFQFELFRKLIKPAKLVGILIKRTPRVRQCRKRAVPVAQHRIGAHQPQPALDVRAVAVQPLCQALDHAADHGVAVFRLHLAGRCNIFRGWTGRRYRWRGSGRIDLG